MSEALHTLSARPLRRFKRYPAYKDSGVEWLGEIPAHWTSSKVKYLGTYINGYAFKPEDWSSEGLPIIRIQNLTNPEAQFNRFAGSINPRYRVTKGDILISWSASLGLFVWSSEEDGWLNQHIFKVVLRNDAVDRSFFRWLGDWFIRELQKETHGSTMTHLTSEMFGGFRVELPPIPEQRAIAAFLDRETARIDALVAKKERLIALLQEKRTALITRAVTKGLDATVPMKDSGVEWLGEIPVHWEVKRLKNCVERIESGSTPESHNFEYWADDNSGIPWVAISDMTRSFYIRDTAKRLTEQGLRSKRLRVLPAGTLLYSIYASLGKVALLEIDAAVNQAILGLVTQEECLSRDFLRWWLEFMQSHVEMLSSSNTQDNLNADKVRTMPVLVPRPAEQRTIAAFLEEETAKIDALIDKVNQAIARLTEFRTALISAAVTGKIDVRGEVA